MSTSHRNHHPRSEALGQSTMLDLSDHQSITPPNPISHRRRRIPAHTSNNINRTQLDLKNEAPLKSTHVSYCSCSCAILKSLSSEEVNAPSLLSLWLLFASGEVEESNVKSRWSRLSNAEGESGCDRLNGRLVTEANVGSSRSMTR